MARLRRVRLIIAGPAWADVDFHVVADAKAAKKPAIWVGRPAPPTWGRLSQNLWRFARCPEVRHLRLLPVRTFRRGGPLVRCAEIFADRSGPFGLGAADVHDLYPAIACRGRLISGLHK